MLYGRGTEQDRIEQLLARAREGMSGALLIHGEAGIGKTALLGFAVEAYEAAAGGAADGVGRVLRTVGIESEMELPFGGLHQLLRPVSDHFDELPTPQAAALKAALGLTGEPVRDRFTVGAAVLAALTAAAGGGPLLCVVDDAQWLDQASLDALTFAARRLHTEGIVILFAVRDGAQGGRIAGLPTLRIAGLGAAAVDALLTDRIADLSPYARGRIVEQAQGNPLALIELPTALTAEQRAGRLNPVTLPAGLASPAGRIQESFQEQIRRLPETTRAMLLVAAADDSGGLDLVLRASARFGATPEDLEPAERATLVILTEHALAFRHPLIRSATYQDAALARRLAAHRALADALDGATVADGAADRRAWHLSAATTGTDEAVADEMVGVARRAGGRQGTAAASAAYERAAQLTADPARRARFLAAAAITSAEAGQFHRTAGLSDRINALALDPATLADFARVRAVVELDRGTPGEATRILLACADRIGPTDDLPVVLAEAVQTAHSAGDPDLLAEVESRIPAAAPGYALTRALAEALVLSPVGEAAGETGDPGTGDAASAARAGVSAPGPAEARPESIQPDAIVPDDSRSVGTGPEGFGLVGTGLYETASDDVGFAERATAGVLAQLLADHVTAYETAAAHVQECRALDVAGWLHTALHHLAEAQLALGRFREAQAAAEEGLAVAEEFGRHHRGTYLRATLATLAALRGDQDACAAFAEAALQRADGHGIALAAAHAHRALGLLELGLGQAESALAHLEAASARVGQPALAAWPAPDLVEAAVRAGLADRAAEPLARLADWAAVARHPTATALLRRCQALTGTDNDAERHFSEALALHDEAQLPFERARTELLYGEWLRRERRRTDARRTLRAALETFEELGTEPWAARARTELQATGEQMSGNETANVPLRRLSPQEREVVRLAAAGATNREIGTALFLSPRTVGHHLYRAFPKLGITSRTELPGLLDRADEAED
ncbi:AAA family ATPase [Streptomyces sp. NPDC048603]|uniref:helix-turn-helix transcriptional regulator n=1 Tax=Streptomyces sp. NPDC048603 TaxID=3365577 RepID=UPI0037104184